MSAASLVPRQPRQGEVFWLADCPPMDGDRAKGRPVVLIDELGAIRDPRVDRLLCVLVTSSASLPGQDDDAVQLPSKATHPCCTSGLTKRSWALPRWFVPVKRRALTDLLGYVSGDVLNSLRLAVEARQARQARP